MLVSILGKVREKCDYDKIVVGLLVVVVYVFYLDDVVLWLLYSVLGEMLYGGLLSFGVLLIDRYSFFLFVFVVSKGYWNDLFVVCC